MKGDLVLATSSSDHKIHGIHLSDGRDAWTVDYAASSSYQLVTDRAVIVFEPDRRVFAVDLATGKTFVDVPIPPLMLGTNREMFLVPALVQDNLLYFVSNTTEMVAVDLNPATPVNRQVRWKTPLQAKVQSLRVHGSQLYGGAATGELLIVDRTSGAIQVSKKVADRSVSIDYVGDDIILANTNSTIQAFDSKTGAKQWESANFTPSPGYFKGVVLIRPAANQIALLDAATGSVVWQYAGSPVLCWVVDDSVYVLESNGVKEYALDRSVSQGITNKEAMTELASVLLSKGDLDEAARFADRVSREADPNYPPLRYLQAQLNRARGNALAARRELVVYSDLVGRQSKAGLGVMAELKNKEGLVWQTELGGQFSFTPVIVEGRLLSGGGNQVAVLDASDGKALWRQNVERLMDMFYENSSKRVFYAHGQNNDPKVVQVYAIGIDGNGRKALIRRSAVSEVTQVRLAYGNNRLFLGTLSIDRQSGRATLSVAAFNAESGNRVWEKTHDYTPAEMAQIRVPFGLFYPRGKLLVYSSGKNMWIVQGEDGVMHAEHHEEAAITVRFANKDSTTFDPDITTFVAGPNDVVAYRLSSKQVILRTRVPAQDPAFSTRATPIRETTFFNMDGPSIIAFDIAPDLDEAKRLKWRITPGPGQRFTGVVLRGNSLLAMRANAGVTTGIDNNVTYLRLDPATGKTLTEFEPLWPPSVSTIDGSRMYAFTADGMAYAMDVK